jgi:predicted transcriptional regulator
MKEKLLVTDVFKALSDENSLSLFNTICTSSTDSEKLMSSFDLSKRQYYDRMNDLRNSCLIKRQKGKYETTSFGHIIFNTLKMVEKAIHIRSVTIRHHLAQTK